MAAYTKEKIKNLYKFLDDKDEEINIKKESSPQKYS